MKRIPLRSVDRDDTQHLQDEIDKLGEPREFGKNRTLRFSDQS